MSQYTSITIIYNPNSTGNSETLALQTAAQLRVALPERFIKALPTEHAGHAEELAYELSKSSSRPLIISSSGDGGYNEVVNGVMRARQEGATAVTGLLPGGNANDHYNALHTGDFIEAVTRSNEQTIDILKLHVKSSDDPLTRYAHSYIGLGLTPEVGHELNKVQLNGFKEAWITGKSFLAFEHVTIRTKGEAERYHNLVFSNIQRMAKILTLAKDARVDDGLFEMSALPYTGKIEAALSLFKASTQGELNTTKIRHYTFQTVQQTRMQLDGEIITVPPGADVTIDIEPLVLSCVI